MLIQQVLDVKKKRSVGTQKQLSKATSKNRRESYNFKKKKINRVDTHMLTAALTFS